jgi:hypothetical protein
VCQAFIGPAMAALLFDQPLIAPVLFDKQLIALTSSSYVISVQLTSRCFLSLFTIC